MEFKAQREQLVEVGRRMVRSGLVSGTGGNLSLRCQAAGPFLVSPSGIPYESLQAADIVRMGADGRPATGSGVPSSEWPLHLAAYRARPGIGAVIHTHSPFATTLACLHWEIPAVHYLVGFAGKRIPLAPYATFGSLELGRGVAAALSDADAALLANHGVVAVAGSLARAFAIAEQVEFVARIYYQARLAGEPVLIGDEEMVRVREKLRQYGQGT